jgi:hypothetical protein
MLAPTPAALRRAGIVAIAAAVVATLSDLALLWASFARAGALGLPAPPARLLTPATYVGALAILCYAVGYWQAACGLLRAGEPLARRVFLFGAAVAGIGAIIHGMTGLGIRCESALGGDPSPMRAIVALLPLWLLGVACGVIGTALYAWAILRHATAYPQWMAAANPTVLPVALAALAMLCGPRVRSFVVPAAPNIAHVVFFTLTTAALRDDGRARRIM